MLLVAQLALGAYCLVDLVDSGSGSLAAVCVGGSHSCTMCLCHVVPKCPHSGTGEEARDLSFIHHLCVP